MNFDPKNFFVGLLDFFSVILPGALLTFLFKDSVGPWLLGEAFSSLTDTAGWVALLISSYLSGHLLFLFGAGLDDWLYGPIRNATYTDTVKHLAKGEQLASDLSRSLARLLFKKSSDNTLKQVLRIKDAHFAGRIGENSVNAFQWCKARLAMEKPEALAIVQGFEAHSKFFRSFSVLLFVLAIVSAGKGEPWIAAIAVLLMVGALWRYIEQRAKSVDQAYWFIITMEVADPVQEATEAPAEPAPPSDHGKSPEFATHAGGVVLWKDGGTIKFLLVQASKNKSEWVLPKGHIGSTDNPEEENDPRMTAVREVREETGVWARVLKEMNGVDIVVRDEKQRIRFFLMEAQAELEPLASDKHREHRWFTFNKAKEAATFPEAKALIEEAERLMRDRSGLHPGPRTK